MDNQSTKIKEEDQQVTQGNSISSINTMDVTEKLEILLNSIEKNQKILFRK